MEPKSPLEAALRAARDRREKRTWWTAQIIATVVLSLPLLAWGSYVLAVGRAWLPLGLRKGLSFEGTSATLVGVALLVGFLGMIAHVLLPCFERLEYRAAQLAYGAGCVSVALLIAAMFWQLFVA